MSRLKSPFPIVFGLFLAMDLAGVASAMLLAYCFRVRQLAAMRLPLESVHIYYGLILVALPLWGTLFAYVGLYSRHRMLGATPWQKQVVEANVVAVLGLILVTFWHHQMILPRAWIVLVWLISTGLVLGLRGITVAVFRSMRRRGYLLPRAIIIGANEHGRNLAKRLSDPGRAGIQLVGFLDEYLPPGTPVANGVRVLGAPSELDAVCRQTDSSDVIIVPDSLSWETFEDVMRLFPLLSGRLCFRLVPRSYQLLSSRFELVPAGTVPLLRVTSAQITGIARLTKLAIDRVGSAALLVICSPIMFFVALKLKKDGRQILDVFEVKGAKGRDFYAYKFHTGLRGSSRRSLALRITTEAAGVSRFGRFLYSTGIDKLPQLINVIQGDMSFVGPRTIEAYTRGFAPDWLADLLAVKPGIVGPWATRPLESLEDELQTTISYVRTWSLWTDCEILLKTLLLTLRCKRGSAQTLAKSAEDSGEANALAHVECLARSS